MHLITIILKIATIGYCKIFEKAVILHYQKDG